VQERRSLPALTARDAAAPGVGDVLSLTTARTDDALAGVTVPTATGAGPSAGHPSHLQEVQAELISRRYPAGQSDIPGAVHPQFSEAALSEYIHTHGGAHHV
jgi:phospholipase C